MTLISAGWNQFGQLGHEGDGKTPMPVDFPPSEYKSISVGQLHSVIVDSNGDVYGWGSNEDGGLSFEGKKEIKKPTKIEMSEKINLSSCGFCNTVLLSESGNVYIIVDKGPWKVELPEPCIYACCGYYIIWAIGRSGKIYQCADVPEDPSITYTMEVPAVKMAAGNGFAVAITENGQAYGYGDVVSANGNEQNDENAFVKIDSLENIRVKKITAFDSHCIAVSDNGKVFVWGNGGQGKLGTGNCENCTIFKEINSFDSKIIDAGAGTCHSCFVTENGAVYGCGSNENGQALIKDTEMANVPIKSTLVSGCVAIQCGGHTMAIINGKPPSSSNNDNDEEVEKTKGAKKEEGEKKGKSSCCLLI